MSSLNYIKENNNVFNYIKNYKCNPLYWFFQEAPKSESDNCEMVEHEDIIDYSSDKHLNYVKSLKGIVRASEFDMHVMYLHSISKEKLKQFKVHLSNISALDQVGKQFLNYVEELRNEKIRTSQFEVHVFRLREYKTMNIDKREQFKYNVLFNEIKKYFWKVIPFSENLFISENSVVENLNKLLMKIDYTKATLWETLRPFGLLELVDDCNIELMSAMKRILLYYHPDRNKDETCKEIFLIFNENIYIPITIILEDFEKFTNCPATSCQLDEYLTWQVHEIKEIRSDVDKENFHFNVQVNKNKVFAVYNHLLSKLEPEGDFGFRVLDKRFQWQRPLGTFTMENYRQEKREILKVKDEILLVCKDMMYNNIALAKSKHLHSKMLNSQGNLWPIIALKEQIKVYNNKLKSLEPCFKENEERMKTLVNYFIPLFEPMIEKYEKEIYYLTDVCNGKIDFSKKYKARFEWDIEEKEKCERKIKTAKLDVFVEERRLNSYNKIAKELKEEKTSMEIFSKYLVEDTKTEGMLAKCINIAISKFSAENDTFKHFSNYSNVAYECIRIIEAYKSIKKKSKCVTRDKDIFFLEGEFQELKNEFKTEEEKHMLESNSKILDKEELLFLIKETRNVESKTHEERIAREEAEERSELYKKLLFDLKFGTKTLDDLKTIDIESLLVKPTI